MTFDQEKEKSEFKRHIKINFMLHPARAERLVNST